MMLEISVPIKVLLITRLFRSLMGVFTRQSNHTVYRVTSLLLAVFAESSYDNRTS